MCIRDRPRASLADLQGGDSQTNAKAILDVLDGKKGPFRDIVLLNAGAALIVGERVASITEGVERAARAIDTGRAKATLEKLIAATNQPSSA